ncbi:MAG: cytochrome c biogenesis protein CcsA, partial [Planctomycetota bacterium]
MTTAPAVAPAAGAAATPMPLVWKLGTLAVAGAMAVATWLGLTTVVPFPPEAGIHQEAIYRTFFFHVPTAINSKVMLFWVLGVSVLWLLARPLETTAAAGRVARVRASLYRRRDLLDRINLACAEMSLAGYTFVLISGMIWADSAWGKPWSWEPRLTSVAVMWFQLVGVLLLRGAVDDRERRQRFGAVFGIILFISVPFISFATTWFAEQFHPGANASKEAIGYKDVQGVFSFCIFAIMALFRLLVMFRVRAEGLRRRVVVLTQAL